MSADVPEGRILTGDCLALLPTLQADSIAAVVTDPPYGFSFMGAGWDHGVPGAVYWREVFRVLKPGGHVVAFGGPRTFHRLAVGIEDAGFEIRDCLSWLFGSGFPKSLNVSAAIEKRRDDEAEVRTVCRYLRAAIDADPSFTVRTVAEIFGFHPRMVEHWAARDSDSQPTLPTVDQWGMLRRLLPDTLGGEMDELVRALNARKGEFGEDWHAREITGELKPDQEPRATYAITGRDKLRRDRAATETAAAWEGWGTALKPGWEPVILARKPLAGTVADTVLEFGTGGINVDGTRIPSPGLAQHVTRNVSLGSSAGSIYGAAPDPQDFVAHPGGRWPANVVTDPEAAAMIDAEALDAEAVSRFYYCAKANRGERWEYLYCDCETPILPAWANEDQSQSGRTDCTSPEPDTFADALTGGSSSPTSPHGSAHTDASRGDSTYTTSTKTSKTTASKISDLSARPNTSGFTQDVNSGAEHGGSRAEHADSLSRSEPPIGISLERAGRSMGVAVPATFRPSSSQSKCGGCGRELQRLGHPTVKPLALMRWLCRLVTPPGGTILDPFAGSGTTGCAAVLEGFAFVGMELDPLHSEIATKRLAYWRRQALEAPLDLFADYGTP